LKLQRYFDDWLRSTRELPLEALLATQGVEMELRPAESGETRAASLRARKTQRGFAMLAFAHEAQGDDTAVTARA